MRLGWKEKIAKLSEIFLSFSMNDVATSLLCSCLWLPNIASPVKHLFLFSLLASLEPAEFQKEDKIRQYKDFVDFLEDIYRHVPSFVFVEDYVPEMDWGEVRFHHGDNNYKIFFGGELENTYDYLTLFQIIYIPYEKELFLETKRSPSKELEFCLKLQDYFLTEIKQNIDRKILDTVRPGGAGIPEEQFWQSVKLFIDIFDVGKFTEQENLPDIFSINPGEGNIFEEDEQSFVEKFFDGTALPYYFLRANKKHYPLMPRRFSAILVDNWAALFKANRNKILGDKLSYHLKCGMALHKYMKGRCNVKHIFPLVTAVGEDGLPRGLIYDTALIAERKLLLSYLVEPGVDFSKELQKVNKELKESLQFLRSQPTTLGLSLEDRKVSFIPHSGEIRLEPYPVIVIPKISTSPETIVSPVDMIGRVLGLDDFLALIDEMANIHELVEFFDFLDQEDRIWFPGTTILDIFGAYKDSAGVLIPGAREPHFISIFPHWGSNLRYRTLEEFWKIYPKVDFFGHPRTWEVKQETPSRVRFGARGYFGIAIYTAIGKSNLFCNAPFEEMNFSQQQLANLLMECLETCISETKEIIQCLAFFSYYEKFQVSFFPDSLVKSNDNFRHLRHLKCEGKLWISDTGFVQPGIPGIRIVFNDNRLIKTFMKVKNNSVEIKLLLEFLGKMNSFYYDGNINKVKKFIRRRLSGRKARFKIFKSDIGVAFPELTSPNLPDMKHIRLARKRVAQIAKSIGGNPGEYGLSQANDLLKKVRIAVIGEINKEVKKFNFKSSVCFLVEGIESLSHMFEKNKMSVKQSVMLEVDHKREERYSEIESKYVAFHKNYRYLIEKFIQLVPSGIEDLTREKFQYLLALIDELHLIYQASDILHYEIQPMGVTISDDYIFEVKHEPGFFEKQRAFGQEQAKYDLGIISRYNDRVTSPRDVKVFLKRLDKTFHRELGFSLRNMLSVCHILSLWPLYNKSVQVNTHYRSSLEEIIKICEQSIRSLKNNEIVKIINYLTLKQENILKINGQESLCDDLPVWEILKRPHRYTLKPLIFIDNSYYWGPYSTRKTGWIWLGRIISGSLPISIGKKKINNVLQEEKRLIEEALEEKAREIVKRFTNYVEKRVKLHKRDKKGRHPKNLGDYDVLAFLQEGNKVLNIECKDILQVFCLKDARGLREKIFGVKNDKGAIEKVELRARYLAENLGRIMDVLKWPVNKANMPQIVSIFVSRYLYWWTVNPPYETDVKFVRIDSLHDFLSSI